MFGIDGTEFLVIILVAAIVIGPKDMPGMLRAFAKGAARLRALAQEFRNHFDEAVRQADMQETADSLRDIGNSVKDLDPRRKLQEFYASLERQTAEEHEQRRLAEEKAERQAAGSAAGLSLNAAEAPDCVAESSPDCADINSAARAAIEGAAGDRANAAAFVARHPFSAASPAGAREQADEGRRNEAGHKA